MKYFAAVLGGLIGVHAAAAPSTPPPPPRDLRELLQQYRPGSTPAPRQLTAVERAELRRQISESAQPPRRH